MTLRLSPDHPAGGPDELGSRLAALSNWAQPGDPAPWRAAIRGTLGPATGGRGDTRSLLHRPIRLGPGTIIATIALGVFLVVLLLPALGKARASRPAVSSPSAESEKMDSRWIEAAPAAPAAAQPARDQVRKPADAGPGVRQVIRRAQISLAVTDVRAAFIAAGQVVSEAVGDGGGAGGGEEFIQESSVTGKDTDPSQQTASLTLRVRADRLQQVLQALRSLGLVIEERLGGEDVTDQIVDLDARLRNERRVEAELLALLDDRRGAPLKDLLEVRSALDASRERIERLVAQRDRLGRLVALATVVVLIRHADAGQVKVDLSPPDPTLGQRVERAWGDGTKALSRSIAWAVEVLVGGLLVWAIVLVAAIGAWALHRRAQRQQADEPPPTEA